MQSDVIKPGQTIGIIGGGQLGRMMAVEARYMGYRIVVLDPAPDCPTAQVADQQITAAYDNMEAIRELTEASDVITYEFENVDLEAAAFIEAQGKLPQGSQSLAITQNREKEKGLMTQLGLPVPSYTIVHDGPACRRALQAMSFPAVIKTCGGGYDGKGQLKLSGPEDIEAAVDFVEKHGHSIIESWLAFDYEISVVFTRSMPGDIQFFPTSQNEHRDHVLYRTTVLSNFDREVTDQARKAATMIAEEMAVVGTFAIEMFVSGKNIYINEMAPRPHNSGHYSIEACNISQFGQHIRAICGLPLMPVELLKSATMVNVFGETFDAAARSMPQLQHGFFHFYGKQEARPGRKMGHVTFLAETADKLTERTKQFEEATR